MKNIQSLFIILVMAISLMVACEDFVVDRLDDKTVQITSPVNGSTLTSSKITVAWEALKEATEYQIQIAVPSFGSASTLLLDTVILASDTIIRKTSFGYTLDQGDYQCRIRAVSPGSSTQFFYSAFKVAGDVNDKQIEIVSPKSGVTVEAAEIIFTWNAIADAGLYEIEIVKPSFDNISTIVEKTALEVTDGNHPSSFKKILADGSYEWRIRASVNKQYTQYSYAKFTVEEGLQAKQVVITAPQSGVILKSKTVKFSWDELTGASKYQLQLATPSFENATSIIVDTDINAMSNPSFEYQLDDGIYEWRIRAKDGNAATPYSSATFEVKEAMANKEVIISSPEHEAVINSANVQLSWQSITGATEYELEIATPSFANANSIVVSTTVATTSYPFTGTNGQYEWRIRAKNTTEETEYTYSKFTIDN